MLTIAESTGEALVYSKDKEMLEEMDKDLANAIEDFMRAVDVEALKGVVSTHCLNMRMPIFSNFV